MKYKLCFTRLQITHDVFFLFKINIYKCCVFQDVKCSGNWMWAAKLPGEGACLWEACKAMCEVMGQLGVAIDGGKDSLSMAARVGKETVKAPGTLTVCVCVSISVSGLCLEHTACTCSTSVSLLFFGARVDRLEQPH